MVQPSDFAPFNLGDILARSQEMQLRKMQLQQAQDEHQQKLAERQAYGQIFAPAGNGGPARPNAQTLGNLARVDPEAAMKVSSYFDSLDAQSRKLEEGKWKAAGPVLVQMQHIPYEQRRQFMQAAAPALVANGWKPEEIASFDPTDQNVNALSSAAMTVSQVVDANTLKWNPIGENGSFATDQFGNPVGSGNPFAPSAQRPQAQPGSGDVFGAVIQQESGGQAGIRGPKTAYGVPLGKTQLLPGTAQEMAGKLGLPWRPELLSGTSPEASSYQEKLGRAYFDEGLQKYGGNVEKALMYYHGGPDESLWGPKTHAYAQSVLARTRRAANPADVRAKAQAAIAAGADPEKVRQRAAALGVTL